MAHSATVHSKHILQRNFLLKIIRGYNRFYKEAHHNDDRPPNKKTKNKNKNKTKQKTKKCMERTLLSIVNIAITLP